jgi:hypothetical protein
MPRAETPSRFTADELLGLGERRLAEKALETQQTAPRDAA